MDNSLRKAVEMALKQLQRDDVYLGHRSKTRADAIEALRQALAQPDLANVGEVGVWGETPPCKTHPDAPHGFDRNASHSADRYVCECEGWEPVDNVDISEECVHKTDKSIHEPVAWILHRELFWPSEYEVISEAGDNAIPLYTAPPQKEWVGLTDEDKEGIKNKATYNWDTTAGEYASEVQALTEAKLKEKNGFINAA